MTGEWEAENNGHAPQAYCQHHLYVDTCSILQKFDCSKFETFEFCPPFSSVAEKKNMKESFLIASFHKNKLFHKVHLDITTYMCLQTKNGGKYRHFIQAWYSSEFRL